ncbi:oxidase [Riemerella anatipestifer]|uniref:oxidase n=1 Tax=Riemerella anatipestifer TaxID=34085 RepID=UPI002A8A7A42|nr:oxidase [Riemerella anatipestifer]
MKDILLEDDGDLKIANGDFVVGESTQQEITHILTSFRGEWKEHPILGAEIPRLLKARAGITKMRSIVREQLEMDGFKKVHFDIKDNEIEIKAERNVK